jgi:hypothetical protein
MPRGKLFLIVGLGSLALLTRLGMAVEPPAAKENVATPEKKDARSAAAGESIEQLIAQLDSAKYEDRETACAKLAAKGKAAIAALETAAAHGNLEVSSRAMTVLGKLLKSSDEATQDAANEALQHLADGDSPAAAHKARSILDKKNGLSNSGPGMNAPGGMIVPGNGFGGQIIINGGQLNIGGGMRTLSVKNINGVKEIDASEDGKTVKIQDDPAQGIKIELSEKENGKEVTKKYDAKNVEELKKKHPAGYELYKKYAEQPGNGIMLRVQAGGGMLIPGGNGFPAIPLQPAFPLPPGQPLIPVPAGPGAAAPQGNDPPLAIATLMVKNLSSRLERLQKAEAFKNASPESKAELKKQIDELSKRLEDLRGQLGDK